jgi:hypothetical protein
MMTTPDTMTTLEALARETVECPGCVLIDDKEGWGRACPDCEGEGEVLRYKELTEKCHKCSGRGVYFDPSDGTGKPEPCRMFRCVNGRVPLQGPALLVAAEGYLGTAGTWYYKFIPNSNIHPGKPHEYIVNHEAYVATDRLAAAVQALAALAQRKEGV